MGKLNYTQLVRTRKVADSVMVSAKKENSFLTLILKTNKQQQKKMVLTHANSVY